MSKGELKEMFAREAKRQVDYALGDNPYGRSYVVGYGNDPFNDVHHRGAYGAWAGFAHLIQGEPEYRRHCRHTLYGALVAGPDHNDMFLCGKENQPWLPLKDGEDHGVFYNFPNRSEPVQKGRYRWDNADQPVQDVMDSKFNEVTLDYNAGFTASLAWLTAHGLSDGDPLPDSEFPPPVRRNEHTDLLTTDREFFVAAREIESFDRAIRIEATLFNRSRWPARVCEAMSFRYYFTPDGDWQAGDIPATLESAPAGTTYKVHESADDRWCVAVDFTDQTIYPGDRNKRTDRRTVTLRLEAPSWNSENDHSHAGMDDRLRLLPQIPVYNDGRLLTKDASAASLPERIDDDS
ncbi:MAG: glycoside hydrolase family 9 protein [bacterium]